MRRGAGSRFDADRRGSCGRASGANADAASPSVTDARSQQYVVAYGNAAADSYSHIRADTIADGHARSDIYSDGASDRYTSADTYCDGASDSHA